MQPILQINDPEEAIIHDLSMNEETLGPAPEVLTHLQNVLLNPHHYPKRNAIKLREALAEWKSLNPLQIIFGNGSEELIYLIPQILLNPGDEVVMNQVSFQAYERACRNVGARVVKVPNLDFKPNAENLIKALTPQTKLLFLDNPGNPTSTYMGRKDFEFLYEHLPPHVLLVLDEAYYNYVTHPDKFSGLEYVRNDKNFLVLRTFSKFYGLAGVRCGWGYGPSSLIQKLVGHKPPLSMNVLAHALVPLAMQDHQHYEKVRKRNTLWRNKLSEFFIEQGFQVPLSQTNFITPHFGNPTTCETYRLDYEQQGICTHSLISHGQPCRLRMTLGEDKALEKIIG